MTDRPRKTLAQLAAEAADAENGEGGIACPRCGCRDLLADKTIQRTSQTIRYRYCRNCGKGVVTKQTPSPEQIVREVDSHDEDSSTGKPSLTIHRDAS